MADPFDLLVYQAVLDAWDGIDGTGNYTYNLSGLVAEGEFTPDKPPRARPPCVAVTDPVTEEGDGPDLPGTSCRLTIRFQFWAPGSSDAASARMAARVRLAADLRRAVRAARASGSESALYRVHNFNIALTTADGRQLGLSMPFGYGEGEITCEYPVGYGEDE